MQREFRINYTRRMCSDFLIYSNKLKLRKTELGHHELPWITRRQYNKSAVTKSCNSTYCFHKIHNSRWTDDFLVRAESPVSTRFYRGKMISQTFLNVWWAVTSLLGLSIKKKVHLTNRYLVSPWWLVTVHFLCIKVTWNFSNVRYNLRNSTV